MMEILGFIFLVTPALILALMLRERPAAKANLDLPLDGEAAAPLSGADDAVKDRKL
jgi:hypothetical protein